LIAISLALAKKERKKEKNKRRYIHRYSIHACMHTYIHTCIHTYKQNKTKQTKQTSNKPKGLLTHEAKIDCKEVPFTVDQQVAVVAIVELDEVCNNTISRETGQEVVLGHLVPDGI
jgi:hypothetical protein